MARVKTTPPVSVIVTVFNEIATIDVLVTALQRQIYIPAEIVVVDAYSTDGTWQRLQELQQGSQIPFHLFRVKGNRSTGRNMAIRRAMHPVIAITDAGCRPLKTWLFELVQQYQKTKKTCPSQEIVVAGYYAAQPQTSFEEAVVPYVLVMPDRINPDDFLPATRSVLLEKSAWESVGGFDERLNSSEDFVFAKALQRDSRIKLTFTAKAIVYWQPRSSLRSFLIMIFQFATWDMKATILRPKVVTIFGRYLFLALLVFLTALYSIKVALMLFFFCLFFYSVWSIWKNSKYVPRGWYWLPVLQITSDWAVMLGTLYATLKLKK